MLNNGSRLNILQRLKPSVTPQNIIMIDDVVILCHRVEFPRSMHVESSLPALSSKAGRVHPPPEGYKRKENN